MCILNLCVSYIHSAQLFLHKAIMSNQSSQLFNIQMVPLCLKNFWSSDYDIIQLGLWATATFISLLVVPFQVYASRFSRPAHEYTDAAPFARVRAMRLYAPLNTFTARLGRQLQSNSESHGLCVYTVCKLSRPTLVCKLPLLNSMIYILPITLRI